MALSNMYGPARVLVDSDYKRIGAHLITPFDSSRVQPASYDVTLGDTILVPKMARGVSYLPEARRLDLRTTKPADLVVRKELGKEYLLHPGDCALVSTAEIINCPSDMICSVDGKSTIGRCFVAVHVTAGFVDSGFVGAVTLELVNHGVWDFVLFPGMAIGQLRFTWLGVEVERPYGSPGLGSHYQGTVGVRAAEPFGATLPAPKKKHPPCEGCGD
jgi:dCTP deaminase